MPKTEKWTVTELLPGARLAVQKYDELSDDAAGRDFAGGVCSEALRGLIDALTDDADHLILIREARAWFAFLGMADLYETRTDAQVREGIENLYDGAWDGFVSDHRALLQG
jgi:hypothetical protein